MPDIYHTTSPSLANQEALIASLASGLGSALASGDTKSLLVSKISQQKQHDHLPHTMSDLLSLGEAERTLLSVATVSGSDAVAYYKNEDGQLKLQNSMDIYPTLKTTFPPTFTYNSQTHDTDEHVRASTEYHLAVRGQDGSMQGLVVLHAPTGDLSRVQTELEALQPNNMNEPPATRRAKITMAEHILEKQKTTLLPEWQKRMLDRRGSKNSLQEKREYFKMLRNDFIHVLGEHTMQADHVQGVADLMTLAVDKVINTPETTIIDAAHRDMLHDITVLHDVGKLQTSVPFLVKKWRVDQSPDSQHLNQYFMGQNHNHPLFSYLALAAYPHEALTTAAHHHGVLRYSEKEMQKGMGDNYQEFRILKDNVPFEQLSSLSKFMRIADVTESITGSRAGKPLAGAIKQMAERAGYDAETKTFKPVEPSCNSIDPEHLCMMIANGFFQSYGQMRTEQMDGWRDANGAAKYDANAVENIANDVLKAFHWEERKSQIEAKLRNNVAQDTLVTETRIISTSMKQNGR